MRFFKKYIWIVLGLGILTLFFFTRFYNILSLPIFTDEAIYIRWAQIAANDAAWRFISLTDGKQPMYVWIAMILMKLIEDPLLAGRLVSVLAGLGTMIGIFFLTSEIFKNRKIGLFASFLYVLYPFALVYDRMALYDSLVAMIMIWALYFEILLVRHIRLDLALILGMIIGLGMLTKTNTAFALILLPFLLVLFDFKDKKWKQKLGKLFIFSLAAAFITGVMYMVLRLSPYFHIIEAKNYVFVYPLSEWLQHPFTYFFSNMSALIDWVIKYMTLPFLVLVATSFLVGKKYLREKILLFVWFIVPFIALAFFGRVMYPRFILFMTIPLLVLGSYALYEAIGFTKKVWLKGVIVVVFITMFVVNDYFIITDFAKAAVPRSDKGQFLAAWPSGVGVPETVAFLKEKSKNQKIYVGTGGTFGLMPYALEIYFVNNPNVTVKGFWPVNDLPPQEVIDASGKMPTYFVLYQECSSCPETGIAPIQWKGVPVLQIKKMEKDTYYTLYQIQAQ
jgi:4-amino-4-deoxy-L-arabinose transferase-like glycosyltransferase